MQWGVTSTERLKLRRQIAAAAGKQSTTSLSLFMTKKVMKKLREEVEKKGLKLSVTENGKEGKDSWRMS